MERLTLGETIRGITREHLEKNNGLLFGECVTAVGWINGTVPDCKNIVELPMSDVASADFAVGAAMTGRRPIFVMRFQGFFALNCNPIVNYAAISKSLHGLSCPIFVRSIGIDGELPTHSSILHAVAMHFPGMLVSAPMTPSEYHAIWDYYMTHDDPMYVSEHRSAYKNTDDMNNEIYANSDIVLYAISDARPNAINAAEQLRKNGYTVSVMHIVMLKPFDVKSFSEPLVSGRTALVIDNGFPVCGAARSIAYELAETSGRFVYAMSCEDRIKGIDPETPNKTPSDVAIYEKALSILENHKWRFIADEMR